LDWAEGQLVEALRLSGRQPRDMSPREWDYYTQDRWMEDLDEPGSGDGEELDEEEELERDAVIEERVLAEDRRALTGQLVDVPLGDEAAARAALLGLVERAVGRLSQRAAEHAERAEAEAAELAERLSLEIGPEEEQLWRYQFGCERSLGRALEN